MYVPYRTACKHANQRENEWKAGTRKTKAGDAALDDVGRLKLLERGREPEGEDANALREHQVLTIKKLPIPKNIQNIRSAKFTISNVSNVQRANVICCSSAISIEVNLKVQLVRTSRVVISGRKTGNEDEEEEAEDDEDDEEHRYVSLRSQPGVPSSSIRRLQLDRRRTIATEKDARWRTERSPKQPNTRCRQERRKLKHLCAPLSGI